MHVKMIEKREIKMASGAKNIKPEGWEGEVPDELANEWIADGAAENIGGDSAEAVAFTPDERAALKHVAGQVLQAQGDFTLDDLDMDGLLEVAQNIEFAVPEDISEGDLRLALAAHIDTIEEEVVEEGDDTSPDTDSMPDSSDDELALDDLSKDELVELAEKAGVEKPRSFKKPELLALLKEKADESPVTDSEAAE